MVFVKKTTTLCLTCMHPGGLRESGKGKWRSAKVDAGAGAFYTEDCRYLVILHDGVSKLKSIDKVFTQS